MAKCSIETCRENVSKEGYQFCFPHWKAEKAGQVKRCRQCQRWFAMAEDVCEGCLNSALDDAGSEAKPSGGQLSSTKLGEHFNIPARRINLVLTELGWIERYVKGWKLTDRGRSLGGLQREVRQTGIPYVVWPPVILSHKVLLEAIRETRAEPEAKPAAAPATVATAPAVAAPVAAAVPAPAPETSESHGFRNRFPATHRTTDGHMVRSRAELLIDNWLYMQDLAHAYERRLPIEEDVYCDFYIPKEKIYIEYWGLEKDPKYAQRKAEKKALYAKYQLRLIELTDEDILNLDDALPRLLVKFGIDCT